MALARRIAAVSVAATDLERIRQLLDQARDKLTCKWMWAAEADAEALLIDVESISGHMDWLRARTSGRPIVCLSSHAGAEYDVILPRPIGLAGLVTALNRADVLVGGGRSAPAPAAPDASPERAPPAAEPLTTAEPAAVAATTPRRPAAAAAAAPPPAAAPAPAMAARPAPAAPAPSPGRAPGSISATPATYPAKAPPEPAPIAAREQTLADYCSLEALPQPARIVRGDNPALTIDAAADCYYGPAALKPLLPYCQGAVEPSEWQPVSAAVMQGLRDSGSAQPLSRLLWLYTLANSSGQLLPGLDLNARYKLAKWPQIEREFPRHFRIATIMMKGPATLAEIADQSGASLADVADFINAYSVIGVAEAEGAASSPDAQRGLLARLRGRRR